MTSDEGPLGRYRASMTEADMLAALKDYTLAEDGMFFHVRNARRQDLEGLSDTLILLPPKYGVRSGTVAFFELKTQEDRVSPAQLRFMRLLARATEIAYGIVRPKPKALGELTLDDALELLGNPGADSL